MKGDNIPSCTIALYIYGDELQPKDVTEALGLEPDSCAVKGDVRVVVRGKEIREKQGRWSYRVRDDTSDIEDLIFYFLQKLPQNVSIMNIKGVDDAALDLLVMQDMTLDNDSEVWIILSPRIYALLAKIGIRFEMYIAHVDKEYKNPVQKPEVGNA